jgi:hypothetical protein
VTRLALDARSCLLGYHHGGPGPTDITFNLKDLRALLALCEDMGANMGLAFSGPGAPLLAEPVQPPGHTVGGGGVGWVGRGEERRAPAGPGQGARLGACWVHLCCVQSAHLLLHLAIIPGEAGCLKTMRCRPHQG